jgi:predicted transcriptional regulator
MDAPADLKTAARQLVDRLPEGATWDDLMYEIYVRQAVEGGLADVEAGRTVSAHEARAELLDPPAR